MSKNQSVAKSGENKSIFHEFSGSDYRKSNKEQFRTIKK